MNRQANIKKLRERLRSGGTTIGSWMQIPDSSVAEIMGDAGYDWVAVDLEHGAVSIHQLPGLFRALELGGTLSLARLAQGHPKDCKQALDAGAGGVIAPMIERADQLTSIRNACRWPPAGNRGVGFSRANLFGKNFDDYCLEAQAPLLVAQIEHIEAVNNLKEICQVEGLDALLIGPYDLSASMGLVAQFDHKDFQTAMESIRVQAEQYKIPCGIHIVKPELFRLEKCLKEGYRFIAYSIDAVFLNSFALRPEMEQ